MFAIADLGYGVLDATVETAALCYQHEKRHDSVWIRLVNVDNKNAELSRAIGALSRGKLPTIGYLVTNADLSRFPKHPFAYWTPTRVVQLFKTTPSFETKRRHVRCGMGTLDDFRFVRTWWEVRPANLARRREDTRGAAKWVALAKAGEAAPFLSDTPLVVNYRQNGKEVKAFVQQKVGSASRKVQAEEFYFRRGLQFGRRVRRLSPAILPAGQIFSDSSNAIFIEGADSDELLAYLGLLSGQAVRLLLSLFAPVRKMEVGYLKRLPVPDPGGHEKVLAGVARDGVRWAHEQLRRKETSRYFEAPRAILGPERSRMPVAREANGFVAATFGVSREDLETMAAAAEVEDDAQSWFQCETEGSGEDYWVDLLSWTFGIAFRRYRPYPGDSDAEQTPDVASLIQPMPVPPRALDHESMVLTEDGILVDDPGHQHDVVWELQKAFEAATSGFSGLTWERAWEAVAGESRYARTWIAEKSFALHVNRYSSGNRKAPIYWQLATPSASYSVWFHYHRVTDDTLYRVLSEYVTPKLKHEERKLTGMTRDAGPNPSSSQREEIDAQEAFVAELRAFGNEVARVAPLWDPDLNDGVVINFAPLWRLVTHVSSWQKECKKAWDRLVDGEYDWAQLAMRLWPERVVPRCADDRSLAIAHGLEKVFWEAEDGKWTTKTVPSDVVDRLVEERTSAAVKSAVEDLLATRTPTVSSQGRRRWVRRSPNRRKAGAAGRDARGAGSTTDNETREAVRAAIATAGGGASKSDVIKATGISDLDWNAIINVLLAQGVVIKTGAASGTRYHHAEKGGST